MRTLKMNTLLGLALFGTLTAGLIVGCGSQGPSDDPPPEPPPATGAEVTVATNATLGSYLADEDGVSLYLFTDGNGNPVPCTSEECLAAWPIFTTDGEPVAGEGVDASLLSTTQHQSGATQVTYNGWPLWYFAGDQASGAVNGQGIISFGGTWYLISPVGNEIGGTGGDDDPPDDDDDDDDDGPRY